MMNMTTHLHIAAGLALAGLAISPIVAASSPSKEMTVTPPSAHLASYSKASHNSANLPDPKLIPVFEYLKAHQKANGYFALDINSPHVNTVLAMQLYDVAIETLHANQRQKAGEYIGFSMTAASFALQKEAACKQPDWNTMGDLLDFMDKNASVPEECGLDPAPECLGSFYEGISSLLLNAYISMDKNPEGNEVGAKCLKTSRLFLQKAADLGNAKAVRKIEALNP